MLWLWTLAWAGDLGGDVTTPAHLELELREEEPMPPCTHVYELTRQAVPAARASSALSEGQLTHDAARAIDGDPATAWVEGVPGTGRGQTLRLALPGEGQVPHGLIVVPGYAKDAARWQGNQRVAQLLIRWLKAEEGVDPARAWSEDRMVVADTVPMNVAMVQEAGQVPFGREQVIDLAGHFHQNMEVTEIVALELVIAEVDGKGARYEDTCISEVAFARQGPQRSVVCAPGWCETQSTPPEGCGG